VSSEQSTNIAARVGRVFAGALVAVGVFWNLWLVFIGIFVYFGASAEAAATIIHLRLGGARVDDLMLLNPEILDPGMTVGELRGHLRRTAQRAFPIVGSAGYVGILETVAVERAGNDAHVGDLVAPAAPVLAPADEVEAIALPHFRSSHTKALAVLDHERVVGLLTVDDVAHLLTDRALHPKP
jgi:CBS domain-containing protein